jgi:hypothetical protein
MRLKLHAQEYVVARTEQGALRPQSKDGLFASICGPDGNTVVCRYGLEPLEADVERGWRLLQVDEALGFSEVGVIASLVGPLAAAGIAVFVLSSFATDWVLVKESALPLAQETLRVTGHTLVVHAD